MITPSGRKLENNSPGQKLIYHLAKKNQPLLAIDTADAFTAIIINKYSKKVKACWISSLGNSTRRGFPDVYIINPEHYRSVIQEIKIATPKLFIIVDADNGGQSELTTEYAFKFYASLNVNLAFVENKMGLKFNSLDARDSVMHELADNETMAKKIQAAVKSQNQTLVGLRLENGIVHDYNPKKAVIESIKAVNYFLYHAMPDFFLFHWKTEKPEIPLLFAKEYNQLIKNLKIKNPPGLACVPTAYSKNVTNQRLYRAGYKIIIYGNPLLRAQLQYTKKSLELIEASNSLKKLDRILPPTKDVLKLIEQ